MWRALKAELIYFRPWLLGGLSIAAFVVVLLSVLVRFLEEGDGPPNFVTAIFPIIAGMVVAFIAQGQRVEERRARLLMAGPLTPLHLAGVTVLLPVCFAGVGLIAAAPMVWLSSLIIGKFEPSTLPVVAGFALQFWAYAQSGPLAQEATAAHRQRRSTATITGWTLFVGGILVLTASQFFMNSIWGFALITMVGLIDMGVTATFYVHRTDFTR